MGVIESTHGAKAGHPGGSLSAADLFAYLYNRELRIDPKNPKDPKRDRFVLSKGHTAPGLYAALAYRGFFPVADLPTLRHIDSYLQGHPNMNTVPGVDMSTGSLGQGISAAAGMAKGAKYLHQDVNVYTLLGDGEIAEGEVWEAMLFAAHYKLDNFCMIKTDRFHRAETRSVKPSFSKFFNRHTALIDVKIVNNCTLGINKFINKSLILCLIERAINIIIVTATLIT